MTHEDFMRRAIALAREGMQRGWGGPFGCVVVANGAILAEGQNRVLVDGDPTAHAEIVALRAASRATGRFHLTGCLVYTSCEPCPMCFSAIYWAHVAEVYYACKSTDAAAAGFDDAEIYSELGRPPETRRIPFQPLLRGEALPAFAEWRDLPNKRPY